MSTPSASHNAKPTPRMGAALTPSASTPSRSVPSPAHLNAASSKTVGRSPWKGTPSASQTPLMGSLNAHTPTPSGPLPPGSSPAINSDGASGRARGGTGTKSTAGSPAGQTPAAFSGLGLTLTPMASGLNVSQQLNDSVMLDTLGLVGRDAEAWTAQKIKEIVDLLGTRWGKVGQDNVKRCVDRIGGLECYWEDHPGGKEKIGERKRTLAIAGNEMMLEIGWLGERVTRVVLNFMRGSEEAVDELGAEILRQDLVGKKAGYVELDNFVENLTRLARIDQLGRGKVSCFEALEGIGKSMNKLWELEVTKEQEDTKERPVAELKTMCERSGRPLTHSDNKIGWRLDYWVDSRAMAEHDLKTKTEPEVTNNPFTLIIDCEAFNANQYPPVRISQAWLSSSVTDAISDPTLPIWDDPPPTYIPGIQVENVSDVMNLGMPTGTQPDVRFISKLRPAITLPLNAAVEILTHMDQPLMQEEIQYTTYLGLLFPEVIGSQSGTRDSKVSFERSVDFYEPGGSAHEIKQRFNVFSQPDFWARTITELPFSNPRQLVDVLPYLRQWAFFGRFLQRSFGDTLAANSFSAEGNGTIINQAKGPNTKSSVRHKRPINGYRHKYQHYEPPSDTDSDEDEPPSGTAQTIRANIPIRAANKTQETLVNEPFIVTEASFTFVIISRRIDMTISAVFPGHGGQSDSCAINLKVHPNAKLEVDNDLAFNGPRVSSIFDSEDKIERARKKIQRVLYISEDIGAALAWLQGFVERSTGK